MRSARFRHGEAVFFIAYTRTNKHVVTAGRDHAVKLWGPRHWKNHGFSSRPEEAEEPGRQNRDRRSDDDGPRPETDFPVALSPDGKRLVGGGEMWSLSGTWRRRSVRELTAPASVFELAFTPDGKELVPSIRPARSRSGTRHGHVARTEKSKAGTGRPRGRAGGRCRRRKALVQRCSSRAPGTRRSR